MPLLKRPPDHVESQSSAGRFVDMVSVVGHGSQQRTKEGAMRHNLAQPVRVSLARMAVPAPARKALACMDSVSMNLSSRPTGDNIRA